MIITESKLINIIKNYILGGYPMVKDVEMTTRPIHLASGDAKDRGIIDRNIITIIFINGKMTHSPSYTGRQIRDDVNRVFGLDIDKYGSDWCIEVKMF